MAVAIENERNEDINDEKIPQLPGGFVAIINLADNSVTKADLVGFSTIAPVSYTHLTLPTIYSV